MPWVDLINLALPVLLLAVGYFVGRLLERRHYASIRRREREACFVAFRNNNWVGFVLWIGMLLALAIR